MTVPCLTAPCLTVHSFSSDLFFSWAFQGLQSFQRNSEWQLTIDLYISMHSLRYEARRKFGEHERCVRVAWGVAKSNSSFLSALHTSQVLHILMNVQMTYEPIVLYHFQPNGKFFFLRDLFADIMSVHNSNMKHACAIEFD